MTINTMLKMVKDLTEDIYNQIRMYGCGWSYEADHKLAEEYLTDITMSLFDIKLNVMPECVVNEPDHKVSENDIPNLVECIGTEATLEQLAEEACELGHAALKQAREMRGENATHKDPKDIRDNLIEEIADVIVTIEQVTENTGYISEKDVEEAYERKTKRMKERLAAEDKKSKTKITLRPTCSDYNRSIECDLDKVNMSIKEDKQ